MVLRCTQLPRLIAKPTRDRDGNHPVSYYSYHVGEVHKMGIIINDDESLSLIHHDPLCAGGVGGVGDWLLCLGCCYALRKFASWPACVKSLMFTFGRSCCMHLCSCSDAGLICAPLGYVERTRPRKGCSAPSFESALWRVCRRRNKMGTAARRQQG